jgi:hypothetical protein
MSIPASKLWQFASRVYSDSNRDLREQFLDWLPRAEAAWRAGNYVHIGRAVEMCTALNMPPPDWLSDAVNITLRRFATGTPAGQGRHARLLRRVAEGVRDIETLHWIEIQRASDQTYERVAGRKRARLHNTNVLDDVAEHFHASSQPWIVTLDGHTSDMARDVARSRDALVKQASRARRLLRDPAALVFYGANFAPSILERLLQSQKKAIRWKPASRWNK